MILATLLVSSQVLVAAPLAFAEESTSSEGSSAISQTIATSSSAASETTSSETATSTTDSKEKLQINAVAIGNALTKSKKTIPWINWDQRRNTDLYDFRFRFNEIYPDGGFTKDWAVYGSVRIQTL